MTILVHYAPMTAHQTIKYLRDLRTAQMELMGRIQTQQIPATIKLHMLQTMRDHADACGNAIERITYAEQVREQLATLEHGEALVEVAKKAHAAELSVIALANRVIIEYENLEDSAPTDHECGECNMGTGPHKHTCAYHIAKHVVG